jgi:phosphate starvation-inducible PhoH-like protein
LADKIITIEGKNLTEFYGVNNQKIDLFIKCFPKLKIVTRGNEILLTGDEEQIHLFEQKLFAYSDFYDKYGALNSSSITQFIEEGTFPISDFGDGDEILVYGNSGIIVRARTPNQIKMVSAVRNNDMIFAIGPAGTGKTYTAVALAVRALKNKQVRKIILTRPAVEAGENLGFLPGDLKEKLDPYMQPLYDALRDMLPMEKLNMYIESGIIQIAPLAFMRGRTLDHAFVILDEAQNATESQMRMFLTRMGRSAKFIITGDKTQIDLPKKQPSGLFQAEQILRGVQGIEFVYLNGQDIVRHDLVKRIVDAYDKYKEQLREGTD